MSFDFDSPAFSLKRLGLLMRNRALEQAPTFGIGAAIVAGLNLLTLVTAKSAVFNHSRNLWELVIGVAMIVVASFSFKEMHAGKSGTDWILLPATSLEKYLAAILDRIVALPLALAAGAWILSALLAAVEAAIGGRGGSVWLPWSIHPLDFWSLCVSALIFAAGSASFRKGAFLKTALIFLGCGLAGVAAVGLAVYAFRRGDFSLAMGDGRSGFRMGGKLVAGKAEAVVEWTTQIFWYLAVPLAAFAYGLARVSEKEARDEVQ